MFVILSAQVLNRSSLQRNGHGLACKLREFSLGGNGHGPVEQIDEVNIPNSATGHENERVHMCFSNESCLLFFWVKFSIVHLCKVTATGLHAS